MAIIYKYAVKYNGKYYPPNTPIEVIENLAENKGLDATSVNQKQKSGAESGLESAQSGTKDEGKVNTLPVKKSARKPAGGRRKDEVK